MGRRPDKIKEDILVHAHPEEMCWQRGPEEAWRLVGLRRMHWTTQGGDFRKAAIIGVPSKREMMKDSPGEVGRRTFKSRDPGFWNDRGNGLCRGPQDLANE